nr:hypothetical protein [Tanacetum cinerariifolium]
MVAILEKGEHNSDFHPMVDFLEASPLMYALTVSPTVPSFSGRIVPLFDVMLVSQGEGSGTPTEPHHTPSPVAQLPSHTTQPTSSLPPVSTTSIPTVTPTETTPIRQYTRRARIAYLQRQHSELLAKFQAQEKQRLQEQIDAQVARDLEEQLEREDNRMSEQISRDAEVALFHAEEELQSMIDGLDR